MILDMKSLFENDILDEEPVSPNEINDETGANLDNTLSGADLMSIMDDICPISGDVFASMKNAAKDPKNLKVTAVKSGDGEDAKLFIEAYEFNNFCEANGITEGEGADLIVDTYKDEVPELDNAEFHVVFPEDSLNKYRLGGENIGRAIKNDWAVRLLGGCRRYGLKVNTGAIQEGGARQKYLDIASDKEKKEHSEIINKIKKAKNDEEEDKAYSELGKHHDKWDRARDYVSGKTRLGNGSSIENERKQQSLYSTSTDRRGDEYGRAGKEEFKKDFYDNSVDKLAEKQKAKEAENKK